MSLQTCPVHQAMRLLELEVSARYMITNNRNTSDGLTDGTALILKHISYSYYKPLPNADPIKKAAHMRLMFGEKITKGNRPLFHVFSKIPQRNKTIGHCKHDT